MDDGKRAPESGLASDMRSCALALRHERSENICSRKTWREMLGQRRFQCWPDFRKRFAADDGIAQARSWKAQRKRACFRLASRKDAANALEVARVSGTDSTGRITRQLIAEGD